VRWRKVYVQYADGCKINPTKTNSSPTTISSEMEFIWSVDMDPLCGWVAFLPVPGGIVVVIYYFESYRKVGTSRAHRQSDRTYLRPLPSLPAIARQSQRTN
jgi:hypothetical protein